MVDKNSIVMRIFLYNLTAVSYGNKCGGSRPIAITTTSKILSTWCEERKISPEAVHLAGELNAVTDRDSRARTNASDWQLDIRVFDTIMKLLVMEIDLFAVHGTVSCPDLYTENRSQLRLPSKPFRLAGKAFKATPFPHFSSFLDLFKSYGGKLSTPSSWCHY